MSDFNDRIERFTELDRRVGYWNWDIDEQWPHHVLYDDGYAFSVCETESADALPTHAKFIVALRNEALPLLREMAQALSEAMAENERLREGVGRALVHLNRFECRQLAAVIDASKELEALHDA